MKAALLLLAAVGTTTGCANNDLSLSIIQMSALTRATSCIIMSSAGGLARNRGVLDVANVTTQGYIAIPIVRNNLTTAGTNVQFNSVQMDGANVKLTTAAGGSLGLPSGEQDFFYASAAGRLDPGGTAPMSVEVVSASAARALAGMIPASGLFTVIANIKPVGTRSGDQLVGGSVQFPVDLCNGCLTETSMCPLPKGTTITDPCLPQQDDPTICCVDAAGNTLCGGAAPIATM